MAIEMAENTARGTLRAGFLASPARLIGLWKPLKAKTIPLVVTAPKMAGRFIAAWPGCRPTAKFERWKPATIRAIPVRAGMTSLKPVIPALLLA